MFLTKLISLVLKPNQLHPHILHIILKPMLIELKTDPILPLLHIIPPLPDLLLQNPNIPLNTSVHILKLKNAIKNLSLLFILYVISTNKFLIILFLRHPFNHIKLSWLSITLYHTYLIPYPQHLTICLFYNSSQLTYLLCFLLILVQLSRIRTHSWLRQLQFLLQLNYLLLQYDNSISSLLITKLALTMSLRQRELSSRTSHTSNNLLLLGLFRDMLLHGVMNGISQVSKYECWLTSLHQR